MSTESARVVGLISDTHGLLRPQVLEALQGVDLIIHAGDVGAESIIHLLSQIAPVVAVRGNIDRDLWALQLPLTSMVQPNSARIYVLHDLDQLDLDPASAGFRFVVSGHSHKPLRTERSGVVYINPGSAGPRRFTLPVTVARLTLLESTADVEFIHLQV